MPANQICQRIHVMPINYKTYFLSSILILASITLIANHIFSELQNKRIKNAHQEITFEKSLALQENEIEEKEKEKSKYPTKTTGNNLEITDKTSPQEFSWEKKDAAVSESIDLSKIDSEESFELTDAYEEKEIDTKENPVNPIDIAAQEFQDETYDPNWADQQQNKYIQLFSDNEELANYVLEDVVCKTSSCKLAVATTDNEQLLKMLNALADTFQSKKESFDVLIDYKDDFNSANLYVKD